MNRIGSSDRVRDELVAAFAEGRGVTAKVRWISRSDDEGRNRWIHCTPLLGQNGNIGVWMVVLVDDEASRSQRRFRQAPPVSKDIKSYTEEKESRSRKYVNPRSGSERGASIDTYASMGSPSIANRDGFDFRTR